jgi:hypothetical protein
MEEGWSIRGREASKRYSPAAQAKVCCRIAQDCTVYTLSYVSIPPVLRRSHSADAVAGVLDEPYSQLIPLSGVAVQAARQSTSK